ncbi:MAG: LacI family DNA-binding transcriptional regulator [Lentisphaeria bacterium]|nr:LacI family DNA-binding transcriptional regulator [Lentisphaeria bacterium]MBR7128415.1 LacI family DNA-binding transcriptional regulator [Lentisphaeria bacterium]
MKKPTIYSIAKAAGLSPATVSKVLNNQGGISEKTVAKVLSIVKKLNYQPQQRKQLNQTLGVIAFHVDNQPLSKTFSSLLLSGVCAETFKNDRTLTFVAVEQVAKLSPDELHCFCINHGISGFLLCNIAWNHPFCATIKQAGIPFTILADKAPAECDYSYVATNNYDACYEIMDYVACLGHKEIAFLGLITDQVESHRERQRAYFEVLKAHNLPIRNEFIIDLPDAQLSTIKNELTRLMSRKNRPTAIFYCSEELTKIFVVLKQMDLKVPEQLSIAGLKMESDNELLLPEISSVIQPTYEIGQTAVRFLLDEIEHKKVSSSLLKNKVIYGNTVKRITL